MSNEFVLQAHFYDDAQKLNNSNINFPTIILYCLLPASFRLIYYGKKVIGHVCWNVLVFIFTKLSYVQHRAEWCNTKLASEENLPACLSWKSTLKISLFIWVPTTSISKKKRFFTLVLTGGFSLKYEWQQASSLLNILIDLTQDGLDSSADLQFTLSLLQAFGKCSKCTNYNWYDSHLLHLP